jgi:hypothetical protein
VSSLRSATSKPGTGPLPRRGGSPDEVEGEADNETEELEKLIIVCCFELVTEELDKTDESSPSP